MKRLLVAVFAGVVGLSMVVQDAEARRLGGSRSFGMSRDTTSVRQAAPAPTAPTASQSTMPAAKPAAAPATAPQRSGMSRWLGPIAGLAAGIGLASLLSHFGLGEGFASILMLLLLVGAAVFVVRMLLRRNQPQPAYAGSAAPARFEPVTPMGGAAPAAAGPVPASFDSEGFLRQAKLNFIRLQAANDAGNLDDLKQFTAPEVYAEIQLQFEERGRAKQETDVVRLEADLLELSEETDRYVASVRFHGEIREEAGGPVQAFAEVWHLTKPRSGGGWLVAGIQQIQ